MVIVTIQRGSALRMQEDQKMRKNIVTIMAAILLATSAMSLASAAGREQARHTKRTAAQDVQQSRNANAAMKPAASGDRSDYVHGNAMSAPAGH